MDFNTIYSKQPYQPPQYYKPQYTKTLSHTAKEFLHGYIELVAYAWLINKDSFWIYPVHEINECIYCFIWEHSAWRPKIILISNIDYII